LESGLNQRDRATGGFVGLYTRRPPEARQNFRRPGLLPVPSRLRRRLRFLRLQSRRGFFQAKDWAGRNVKLPLV